MKINLLKLVSLALVTVVIILMAGCGLSTTVTTTATQMETTLATTAATQTATTTTQSQDAANFLKQLYSPSIGLCRETSTSETTLEPIQASDGKSYTGNTDNIYWIASDNYLDSLALKPYDAILSESIKQKCDSYLQNSDLQGLPYYPYQIMAGNLIPLTLHVVNNYVLEQTSDNDIIASNMSNGETNGSNYSDYPSEGDMLVYEAINYYIQGYPIAWSQNLYMTAYNMFDGKGVEDAHYSSASEYDNYKLALLIFGAKVLNLNVNLTQIESQLWSAQEPSGGIIACMDSNGNPIGTANNETTALTLLAYDKDLISQIQSERVSSPSQNSLNVSFPTATFNQNTDILSLTTVNDLTSIPLLDNWQVTINNTIQWASTTSNPRVALGFYSSLADAGAPSIQIIEYNDGSLDVVNQDGTKLQTGKWANPLTISLISGTLTVSSSAGSYHISLPSFSLVYITAGSTESDTCSGGEVDAKVEAVP